MSAATTATAPVFVPWGKTPRLFRDVVVTEKIDGTNGAVIVTENGGVFAQSRNRLVFPNGPLGDTIAAEVGLESTGDNAGFASWVYDHADELRDLGPGHHFGEWYGAKIGRTYGLGHKRFALFNTGRWAARRPACCDVVPVLYHGPFSTRAIENVTLTLAVAGSALVPGFGRPEGVIVYHAASRQVFKVLIENDRGHKGAL